MGKLHETLAVESSLAKTAQKLMEESKRTFSKKNLFLGGIRRLSMFDDSQSHLNTEEAQELTTTVDENLDYLMKPVAEYWDVVVTKDIGNQLATANLTVDGTLIAENLPATFLLGLEQKLSDLRAVYDSIPTLEPGIPWAIDHTNEKPGVFTAPMVDSFKSEKTTDFRIVVEPTEHHPAQVRELSKDVNIGKYSGTRYCGMLTPVEKAARLTRIDMLLRAVKKARQRANDVDIPTQHVAEKLLDFINNG